MQMFIDFNLNDEKTVNLTIVVNKLQFSSRSFIMQRN